MRNMFTRGKEVFSVYCPMCGDVKKCSGPTESNIQDLFNKKGLKIFHQNVRGFFHNLAKLSTFLQTHESTHIFSPSETHINNSIPT